MSGEVRVEVVPGEGAVARYGETVVVIAGDPTTPAAAALLALAEETAGGDDSGRLLARRVAGWLGQLDAKAAPAFGIVGAAAEGHVVVLHGPVVLTATGPGVETVLSGEDRPTWVDDYVAAEAELIVLGASGVAPGVSRRSPFDLRDGIVPGAGVVIRLGTATRPRPAEAAAPDRAPPPPPVPAPPPPPPEPFHVVDLTARPDRASAPLPRATDAAPESEPDPATLVEGKLCIRGHFNDVAAHFCAHCGISMVQVTEAITLGERPPLGILVFEDGRTFTLDSDYVVGREPESDPSVRAGSARPIEITGSEIISRVHAGIHLTGWEVELVDRHSSNGTYLREGSGWRRLQADTPERLVSGAEVRLGVDEGARIFTFDSHHRPS